METVYRKNNPLVFRSQRIDALNEAYRIFSSVLEDYIRMNNLDPEDIKEIKKALNRAYQEKKLSYYLDYKINKYKNYIDFALDFVLNNLEQPHENKEFKTVFYLKHTKQLMTNEQY